MMGVSGSMFLLVPAHLGCPGQNSKSHKMVVCETVTHDLCPLLPAEHEDKIHQPSQCLKVGCMHMPCC